MCVLIKSTLLFFLSLFFQQMFAMSGDGDIQAFDVRTMDLAVNRIALANIRSLTPWYAHNFDKAEEREKVCEDEIMVHARRDPERFRVLTVNGEVAGFVSYTLNLPWYRRLVGSTVGANAMVHHLAIDSCLRNQGYGSRLLQAVIDDCRRKEANKISLWTNDEKLKNFYAKKHGFQFVRSTKLLEHNFALRLRPHPLLEGFRYILNALRFLPK